MILLLKYSSLNSMALKSLALTTNQAFIYLASYVMPLHVPMLGTSRAIMLIMDVINVFRMVYGKAK